MCKYCQDRVSQPYPLSGGWIAVRRAGQEDPNRGDRVRAMGYIFLPCDRKGYLYPLIFDLFFDERLTLLNDPLSRYWGKSILPPDLRELFPNIDTPVSQAIWRYQSQQFFAETWREAMSAAWDTMHAEIMKLEDMLQMRKDALQKAECPSPLAASLHTLNASKRKITIVTEEEHG